MVVRGVLVGDGDGTRWWFATSLREGDWRWCALPAGKNGVGGRKGAGVNGGWRPVWVLDLAKAGANEGEKGRSGNGLWPMLRGSGRRNLFRLVVPCCFSGETAMVRRERVVLWLGCCFGKIIEGGG
ncbi:hypothetical protein HAX54_043259 [Datura stramonium]|uniref:Uncharacterized protein n=1 Tax=Datura stramonium TaxID=4076 RepID=A0ABS8W238_DATST|nr:hypothetical protein [Datura stramonium]